MVPEGFTIDEGLPEGFVIDSEDKSVPEGFKIDKKQTPFMEKHPTLYGIGRGAIVETAKDLSKVAWLKYIYPSERKTKP